MKSKKYINQGAIGCFIALMLFIALVFGVKFVFEANTRLDTMEIKQEQLQAYVIVKSADLIKLQHAYYEQEVINSELVRRLENNHEYQNDIAARAYANSIDIDNVSYEGISIELSEIWTYLYMVERMAK